MVANCGLSACWIIAGWVADCWTTRSVAAKHHTLWLLLMAAQWLQDDTLIEGAGTYKCVHSSSGSVTAAVAYEVNMVQKEISPGLVAMPGDFTLHCLAVMPNHRLKGIGSTLVLDVLEKCRRTKKVVLEATPSAVEFFKTCGFGVLQPSVRPATNQLWMCSRGKWETNLPHFTASALSEPKGGGCTMAKYGSVSNVTYSLQSKEHNHWRKNWEEVIGVKADGDPRINAKQHCDYGDCREG